MKIPFPRISELTFLSLLLATLVFGALPLVFIWGVLGGHLPQVPVAGYNDADYYFERMKEVADGYPMLGNPYFFEHRMDPPPAFVVADWIAVVPMLLGASLVVTMIGNFFFWTFVSLLLLFVLLRRLDLSVPLASIGSVFTFALLYLFMIRPVSMQEVFPFFLLFLIAYREWLRNPTGKLRPILLGLTAVSMAYLYTYAWQIVVVIFILTPLGLFVTRDRLALRSFGWPALFFSLSSLPMIALSWKQVSHPLYFETMHRIGLVETHVPIFAAFTSTVWIPVVLVLLTLVTRREYGRVTPFFFFTVIGIALVGVTFSTVVTGKDLELPQHIERFGILWLGLATTLLVGLWSVFREVLRGRKMLQVGVALLSLVVIVENIRYLEHYGPQTVVSSAYDRTYIRNVQDVRKPLDWLATTYPSPAVVWTDPRGAIRSYVAMYTPHYALFAPAGAIHIVSQQEVEERYLVANYFGLSPDEVIAEYQQYGGVGNAFHRWKTHNRTVLVCRKLMLDRISQRDCGETTDAVSYRGRDYFTQLHDQLTFDIQPAIGVYLRKYQVSFIVHDRLMDSARFRPERLQGFAPVYDDGRFVIFRYTGEAPEGFKVTAITEEYTKPSEVF